MFVKIFLFVFCLTIIGDNGDNEKLEWWQTSVVYQVYPRSFKDSNEDGIGDLKGIEEEANYFKETGIGAVWLSPIFKSPMTDMGYDVSDFLQVDTIFGTNEDFISLQKKLQSLGIKLLLDFVPNHTSDEHEWFRKSVKKVEPYTNYYVWRDPKTIANSTVTSTGPLPPNNWVSVFGGSAWKYSEERKQFYLHQFAEKQPDLNYRSKDLVQSMKDVLKFWLDKGVNGFRVDSVPYLVEQADFKDEPVSKKTNVSKTDHDYLDHVYTMNQPESLEIVHQFREVLDEYKKKDGNTRLLMTEAYVSVDEIVKYYGTVSQPIAHIPFNFFLLKDLNGTSNAVAFNNTIHKCLDKIPQGMWPNWVLENHDNHRVTTRFNPSLVDGLNMILLLLPGTPIVYYGEEIGMEDTKVRWEQTTDIQAKLAGIDQMDKISRDPERTPFQWNSSTHAGFSKKTGNAWLPVNPNYYYLNVEAQKRDPRSHYNIFKKLIKLAENPVIRTGLTETYVITDWVFSFKRSLEGDEMYVVVINLNNEEEFVTLNTSISGLPLKMNVFLSSINSEYNVGEQLSSETGFKMRPMSALVLQAIIKLEAPAEKMKAAAAPLLHSTILSSIVFSIISKFIFELIRNIAV